MNQKNSVFFLQELSTNAWPPKRILFQNGWILRIGEGITKRANSVLPLFYHGSNVEKDIEQIEEIYTSFKIPIVFQLPDYYQPQNLSSVLLAKGYVEKDESLLMTVKIDEFAKVRPNAQFTYEVKNSLTAEWLQALEKINGYSESRSLGVKKIIKRIIPEKLFYTCLINGKIVGVALIVVERGFIGIYNMAVDPEYRRKGIAQSLVCKMIDYAEESGLMNFYLQVQGDNEAAISLYNKLGFKEIYRYRYYIKK